MVLRFSSLLLFHLLLFLCGNQHGITAVRDLKEKQQDSQTMNDIKVNDFSELPSQILKEFEDAYSQASSHKNGDNVEGYSFQFSKIANGLENKQSLLPFYKNQNVNEETDVSQLTPQVIEDLKNKYSFFYFHKNEDGLENKQSLIPFYKNEDVNERTGASKLTPKVVEDLEKKYSIFYFHKNDDVNEKNSVSQLPSKFKDLEDKYSVA